MALTHIRSYTIKGSKQVIEVPEGSNCYRIKRRKIKFYYANPHLEECKAFPRGTYTLSFPEFQDHKPRHVHYGKPEFRDASGRHPIGRDIARFCRDAESRFII